MEEKKSFLTTNKDLLKKEQRLLVNVFLDFLSVCEFDLYIYYKNGESYFKLKDITGCNFGEIEDDTFANLNNVLGRLEMYANDSIYGDIEEQSDSNGVFAYYLNDCDMILKILYESVAIGKILKSITPDVYVEENYEKEKGNYLKDQEHIHLFIRYLISETIDELFNDELLEELFADGICDTTKFTNALEEALKIFQFKDATISNKINHSTVTNSITVDIYEGKQDYSCRLVLERDKVDRELLKSWFFAVIIELIKVADDLSLQNKTNQS